MKMPKSVQVWQTVFVREGYPYSLATKMAIQRAYEEDEISEALADKLELRYCKTGCFEGTG